MIPVLAGVNQEVIEGGVEPDEVRDSRMISGLVPRRSSPVRLSHDTASAKVSGSAGSKSSFIQKTV